jgi:hypothetical protein
MRLLALGVAGLVAAGCGDAGPAASPTVDPKLVRRGAGEAPAFPVAQVRSMPAAVRAKLAEGEVGVVDLVGRASVKPSRLSVSDDADLVSLSWSSWSVAGASGSGVLRVRRCDPSCATGKTVELPARVSLSQARVCRGMRYFNRAAVVVPGSDPPAAYIRAPC